MSFFVSFFSFVLLWSSSSTSFNFAEASSLLRTKNSSLPTNHPIAYDKSPNSSPLVDDMGASLSFLVMSDTHLFTPFSFFGDTAQKRKIWDSSMEVLSHIKEQYGGELVMMPGDSVSYGQLPNDDIKEKLNATYEMSMNEAIYTAGYNCYTTVRQLYSAVGYDIILAAVGDHELGGNKGFRTGKRVSKISTISSYRQAVADGYNKDPDLNFLYTEKIGSAE